MKIAFYAPLKSPDSPIPSGDRKMARQFIACLRSEGHDVRLISRLKSREANGIHHKQIIIKKFKLPFSKFMRLNANWSFGPKERTTDPHTDHPWDHKVFILYLTPSKGETIIYKEQITYKGENYSYMIPVEKFKGHVKKKIYPQKNRALVFSGLHYHCHRFPKEKINDTVDPNYTDGSNKLTLNRRVILIASFA